MQKTGAADESGAPAERYWLPPLHANTFSGQRVRTIGWVTQFQSVPVGLCIGSAGLANSGHERRRDKERGRGVVVECLNGAIEWLNIARRRHKMDIFLSTKEWTSPSISGVVSLGLWKCLQDAEVNRSELASAHLFKYGLRLHLL